MIQDLVTFSVMKLMSQKRSQHFQEGRIWLYLGWKRIEAGFSRLRLKCEQERKSYRGCSVHTLWSMGLFLCVCDLAGTHTYTDMHTDTHMQTGAVRGTDCLVNSCEWELVLGAVGGSCCILRPYHRTQHLTQMDRQTDGRTQWAAARCHSRALKPTTSTHTPHCL